MAPPTRRRRPATCFLLALLAQRATTFAPRPRLAATPRHRHTPLASSSKPLPDSNIPGLTRDKDDLPGDSEEDAAAVEVLESTTEAAVAEAPAEADQYADMGKDQGARPSSTSRRQSRREVLSHRTEERLAVHGRHGRRRTQKEEEASRTPTAGVVEGMKKELE